jgi:DNA-binding IclR family transcriptional regulator
MSSPAESRLTEAKDGTVHRVVKVLTAIVDRREPISISELAESVKLSTSTTHRLVNLLRTEGLVDIDPRTRRYMVGAELYRLSATVLTQMNATEVSQPILTDVAEHLSETVLLGLYLRASNSMTFIARADGPQALQYRIELNRPMPLAWGASGKVLLAFLPDDAVNAAIENAGLSPASGAVLPDRRTVLADLATIRANGYAVSENEKLPGAAGVAVPVFGRTDDAVLCLCLTRPKERAKEDELAETVQYLAAAAAKLSRLLGGGRKVVIPTREGLA